MKNLANCTPDEFMAHAVKIRGPLMDWMENIGLNEIRSRKPEGFDGMEQKEKEAALAELAIENMGEILAAALEKDPENTRKLMCLCTLTEPEEFNTHTMPEYFSAILEVLRSEEVRGFFTLYLRPNLRTSFKG